MSTLEKQATANVHDIVKNNQLELLRSVVSQDSTAASLTDATGNTPLHTCSACGLIHIATFLCETALVGSSPRNKDRLTPLHLACEEGHLTVASYLTDERGCDPSVQDNEGKTPLHLAAANNRLSIVRYLVEEKRVDVNCKTTKPSTYIVGKPIGWAGLDAPGKTPLHYACIQGHALVVEYLLTLKECDPMCLDDHNISPLFYSSFNGHLATVRKLKHGIDKPNTYGNLPLHAASSAGHLDVVKYFICEKGVDPAIPGHWGRTPLHSACLYGHKDTVTFLLDDQGCDPMILDENDITPLYMASRNGHLKVVRLLVDEKGCDFSFRNKGTKLPLHVASHEGHLAVVRYFICEKGVDPAIPGWQGRTPLHNACYKGHQDMITFLLDQGCDPMILDENHVTPLYLSSKNGHLKVVQLLVDEKGCDVFFRNKDGDLPLHAASLGGHIAVVRYFICKKGVNPATPGWQGRTPLHNACQGGHKDIITFLLDDQGCDPMILDENNVTPLYLASMSGHLKIIKICLKYFANMVYDPDKLTSRHSTSVLIESFERLWKPSFPFIKLFVVGDSKSGKSSLVKSLTDESKDLGGVRNAESACSFKSGILVHDFTSVHYGNVTICELAGPREFYNSLSAELKIGVFILVVNVADSDFKRKLSYWMNFLRSSIISPVKIILICSHSDVVFSNYLEECRSYISETHRSISSVVTTDCRKSASTGMLEWHSMLASVCRQQRKDIHLRNICFITLQFLLQHYENISVVEFSTAFEKMLNNNFMSVLLRSSDSKEAYKVVTELNSSDLILFFKNPSCETDGWIVLDKAAVVSLVHTAVDKCTSTNITGLVTYNQIKMAAISVNLNETFLLEYLLNMRYCYEVKDDVVLSSIAVKERVFFFPHLIDTEPSANVWPERNFNYVSLGWTYLCSSSQCFLLPNFIQVLLLRLVYHFKPLVSTSTSTYLQKHLCMWKNGVYCTDGAVECLVEVSADSSAVHLMMRTESLQQLTQMYKLQSSIISKILSTHQEYGAEVNMDELLVIPSAVKGYPPNWNEDVLISIHGIADAVITSKSHITISVDPPSQVKLASVLPTEPLVGLSSDIIKLIFSETKDSLFSDEFLHQLASEVYNKSKSDYNPPLPPIVNEPVESVEMCFAHIDKWRREGNETFGALVKEISSCSVFCEGNPLDLANPDTLDDSCSRHGRKDIKKDAIIAGPVVSTVVCDSLLKAFESYEEGLLQALEDPNQFTDGLLHCGLVTLPVAEAIRSCTDELLCKKIIRFSIKFQIQKDETKFNNLCSVLKGFPATVAIANAMMNFHIESEVQELTEKQEVIANGMVCPEQSIITSSAFEELMEQADIGNPVLTAVHCYSHHLISKEMLALIFLSIEPKEVLIEKLKYLILTEKQESLTVLKSHKDTADLAKKLEGMKFHPEFEVIAEESFVVKGPEELIFDRRREYGFLLEVPAGAVRLKEGCVVKVKTCLPRTTPVGMRLLSAVYEITTPGSDQHPLGPVKIEMEHCALVKCEDELKQLNFLTNTLSSSESQSPLQLQKTKNLIGNFSLTSCYGSVTVRKFSPFGIFGDSSTSIIYSARVYLQNESFVKKAIYFILLKYLKANERAIEKHYSPYSREEVSVQGVVFSDGSSQVKLNIEREQYHEGWKIWTNAHPLIISKHAVESFNPGNSPPECKVLAKASDGAEDCLYHIDLEGTEHPRSVTVNLSRNDGPTSMTTPHTGYGIWPKIVIAILIAMGFLALAVMVYFLLPVGHCTSVENWRDVDNVLKYRIVGEWRDLGRELGVEDYILKEIEMDHKQSVKRRRQEMIEQWFTSSPQTCWEELVQALERIDQNKLAKTIEQKKLYSFQNVVHITFIYTFTLIGIISLCHYVFNRFY